VINVSFLLLPRAIPGVVGGGEGGLVTVLEGLAYLRLPCARVLSVAGFFALASLFPLGFMVYSEVKSMPDIPRI